MVLHVTFSDGSNPWRSLPAGRADIARLWREWMKKRPLEAWPSVHFGGWRCEYAGHKGYIWVYPERGNLSQGRTYKHIGHALRALERFGAAALGASFVEAEEVM